MLYIVATPIGNLEDISLRALRILGEVDFVLCEDTRVTKRILDYYKITTPTISYHQHTDAKKENYIIDLLSAGKDLALVSDAGTPGISDPGGKLVAAAIEKFGEDIKIESVPGPSAVTAALSISGIATDRFMFLGFPPHKKGRQTFLTKIVDSEYPVVVYESKHRILKFLDELKKVNQDIIKHNLMVDEKRSKGIAMNKDIESKKSLITSVVVCRELSKMHETVYRGEVEDIINKIKDSQNDQKGEFVVIIGR
ncbi:MAG: Ribosomal RNA small subunit methyltransferase I [Candidatus Falkowbacteria bacterium GW2011_GWC2_38_22]|uniref:Ribosomal RNA small subunit methyltransferase I n=1 Tax=Candidatus Falkowbacteria bacterium GW2011_GWE1_38_31 TaxID=1618638 RepID=A0A0G0MAI2_9BACT|nr:MAG: Ribosomal RNA small subunit methyltransferase I [Candidatus Falkowbacteria bacterium GW2011_GWF2_38_1205]KKQ61939.1 MAG: Ribosomal RNA small subunit methyltransferase I [Candidatus Falkowbacteria bacterium GW2011_GWC2_38_22]KKQ63899.1 MAG: Ribosomal RNA small subunit methyltransferase I [Candidatus Falkowbacteria bacterium GW2011_GWF1_38_22]KKQ66156.1 MAG: Ribosomal RNA small subunit methyltransferase I [Candidatus Falkowbacteria bacterium GW2011_GWE2_38_254]KKQ70759.1 MAG: Ribosomal RN